MANASVTIARPVDTSPAQSAPPSATRGMWRRSTLAYALAGSALLWAALPPLELWPLAWLAPIPWVSLALRDELPGRRPYRALWLAGFVFWLGALHWLTLPHWATAFGWIAISFYLAFYLPLFVALSRVAIHQLRVWPILAVPMVWAGLELAQARLLTGFAMTGIAHTQYCWTRLIQICDLAGTYAVSFLMLAVATCAVLLLPRTEGRRIWWPVIPLIALPSLVLAYGTWRLADDSGRPGPTVALIQGSIDTEMKSRPDQATAVFKEYFELSRTASQRQPKPDLIVWPETMFPTPWYTFEPNYQPPADAEWTPAKVESDSREAIRATAMSLQSAVLLGIQAIHYTAAGVQQFNSALLADSNGEVLGRYDKMHLVMFGEYVPGAKIFPWLYRLTPLPSGADAGQRAESVRIGDVCYAANICFESTLSHFIRGQINSLASRGETPDVLVNLTNDGWFWGSSELDMHLACGVFRAIECRKPLLIAANTGFSAWIDADGAIIDRGPRRATGIIIARPRLDNRHSWYLVYGDWPAGICLLGCAIVGGFGLKRCVTNRRPTAAA